MPYPVVRVWPTWKTGVEQLGSKPKFWYSNNGEWLFKHARTGTGEDWSEKVASEIARLLWVPCAQVELAEYEGRPGSASRNFVNAAGGETLWHGNDVLAGLVAGYDSDKQQHQSEHTLKNIIAALNRLFEQERAEAMFTQLAGYIVLDALIGNTDRHHENWGLIVRPILTPGSVYRPSQPVPAKFELIAAPSFDHASSLGRELTDERRELWLKQGIGSYANRGRGGIYIDENDRRGANPLHLLRFAMKVLPKQYFAPILQRVRELDSGSVQHILQEVPQNRISTIARRFASEFMAYTSSELVKL